MNAFRLGASVSGVAAVVIFAQPVYAQISAEQQRVQEVAKEITVYLEVPGTSGSGVLIKRVQGDNGDYIYTVLTAYHVVGKVRNNEEAYVTVGKGNKKERKYRLSTSANAIRKLGNWDLAIAQFSSKEKYEVAAISDSTKLSPSEEIYVAGFPKPSQTVTETYLRFKSGSVDAILSQPNSEGYQLVYDNQTIDGMSGGAVLNRNRELVAIHGQSESNPNGKGRNLGIPTALFRDRLDNLSASLDKNPPTVVPVKPDPVPVPQVMKAEDYLARGLDKYKKSDYQGAIADYNEAIRINPNYAAAYNNRRNAKYALGDKQGVIADYNEVIRINPNDPYAYYGRGEAKYALGDKQGAISDYTEIIRIDPNNDQVYISRGKAKYALGDKQGAISDYTEAIRIYPNFPDPQAYYKRGDAKYALGDKQGAISDYTVTIQTYGNPYRSAAYYKRGLIAEERGEKQKALEDFWTASILYQNQGNIEGYNKCRDRMINKDIEWYNNRTELSKDEPRVR